jgi:hypothetical protein
LWKFLSTATRHYIKQQVDVDSKTLHSFMHRSSLAASANCSFLHEGESKSTNARSARQTREKEARESEKIKTRRGSKIEIAPS